MSDTAVPVPDDYELQPGERFVETSAQIIEGVQGGV